MGKIKEWQWLPSQIINHCFISYWNLKKKKFGKKISRTYLKIAFQTCLNRTLTCGVMGIQNTWIYMYIDQSTADHVKWVSFHWLRSWSISYYITMRINLGPNPQYHNIKTPTPFLTLYEMRCFDFCQFFNLLSTSRHPIGYSPLKTWCRAPELSR